MEKPCWVLCVVLVVVVTMAEGSPGHKRPLLGLGGDNNVGDQETGGQEQQQQGPRNKRTFCNAFTGQ